MFELAEGRGSCQGVYCGREGLYVGSAALIERREGQYRIRDKDEIAELLGAAYEPPPDIAGCFGRLREIAASLQEHDPSRAMIAALQMRLGELSEVALARLARIDGLLKYNFNLLQPRNWHGRWGGSSSPGIVPARAGRPAGRSPGSGKRARERFPNAEFRNRLAIAEGNTDKPDFGYGEVRQSTDALGRYQMTREARRAAGMIDADGHWTGKYGIHSRTQFLADHSAQENALTDYLLDTERQLRANGSFQFIDKRVEGLVAPFTITRSGLLAAGHRSGARATRGYLDRVERNGFTSQGLGLTAEERVIETRLRTFADVPYE
jgi:hypothetical protein